MSQVRSFDHFFDDWCQFVNIEINRSIIVFTKNTSVSRNALRKSILSNSFQTGLLWIITGNTIWDGIFFFFCSVCWASRYSRWLIRPLHLRRDSLSLSDNHLTLFTCCFYHLLCCSSSTHKSLSLYMFFTSSSPAWSFCPGTLWLLPVVMVVVNFELCCSTSWSCLK